MNINKLHKIYFLGIGGIGMSALARYFHQKGIEVFGYDKTHTAITDELIYEGISIHFEEDIELLPDDIDLVIYTPAIPKEHTELIYFKEKNYPIKKRSEILGLISKDFFTIAVAGTHGKTTITSLISHILLSSGKSITALIGGISNNLDSNFVSLPDSEILVVEADEFDRSFLTLNPDIAVISSMDADHLDIYDSKEFLEESFMMFSKQIKDDGNLIIRNDLKFALEVEDKRISYSIFTESDVYASEIRIENGQFVFNLNYYGEIIHNIILGIPGFHNVENAVAASVVALELGVKPDEIKNALQTYTGVKRRFDIRINREDFVYIDDYAHHPEELKACINSVKMLFPDKKICGIFQPHLFSRTRDFADDFAQSLELLDEIILLEIYPAREKPIKGVNSEMLLNKINSDNKMLLSNEKLLEKLKQQKPEVLLTLGAGNIDVLVERIEEIFG
ncbi:MAG: UDP-N-acetylmuramate--L-alanine ligase [Saprospiraceae bacterium]|nr:UDP-N-acetylmuramate--L-alanine ligase [Saprospiraceae bacterium]